MSVTFTWDNSSQTQLRFIFDELWQTDDLADAIYFSKELIEDRNEVVDVIIDMSACDSMPANLSYLQDHLKSLDNTQIGVMVFVTQNIYVKKVMQLLNQLLMGYFTMYFTYSLTDANRIIQRAATTRGTR